MWIPAPRFREDKRCGNDQIAEFVAALITALDDDPLAVAKGIFLVPHSEFGSREDQLWASPRESVEEQIPLDRFRAS